MGTNPHTASQVATHPQPLAATDRQPHHMQHMEL
jgi:hypothetical protein